MEPDQFGDDAARYLAEFGGVILTERSFDRVLELVTEVTQRAVPTAELVSVTLMREGSTPFTSHASNPSRRSWTRSSTTRAAGRV